MATVASCGPHVPTISAMPVYASTSWYTSNPSAASHAATSGPRVVSLILVVTLPPGIQQPHAPRRTSTVRRSQRDAGAEPAARTGQSLARAPRGS